MENRIINTTNNHAGVPPEETVRLLLTLARQYGYVDSPENCDAFVRKLKHVADAFCRALQESEESVNFAEAAESSLLARAHRRPSTVADLRSYINRMCRNRDFALRPIRQLSIHECRYMLHQVFGHSQHTYRKAQSVLHSIFNYAIRQRWCEYNPAKAILRPPVIEQRITPLTLQQIRSLLTACRANEALGKMETSLRLMIWCGIRPAEVRRLCWGDVDYSEKVVYVDSASSKTGGARAVPIRGGCLILLKEKHAEREAIAPKDWNRLWRRLRQVAGFSSWQNDALRHTFASMHLMRFHNLPLLQEEMGHRNASLLQTRYLNLRKLRKSTAARFFDAANWG